MRNYNEETLADLLRTLPAPPDAWVKAAQEIPLARRGLDDPDGTAVPAAAIETITTAVASAGWAAPGAATQSLPGPTTMLALRTLWQESTS